MARRVANRSPLNALTPRQGEPGRGVRANCWWAGGAGARSYRLSETVLVPLRTSLRPSDVQCVRSVLRRISVVPAFFLRALAHPRGLVATVRH